MAILGLLPSRVVCHSNGLERSRERNLGVHAEARFRRRSSSQLRIRSVRNDIRLSRDSANVRMAVFRYAIIESSPIDDRNFHSSQQPTSMSLTREQVAHIAELAKLELTEAELERMARQLSDILDYAERLKQLDTDAIAPTASVIPNQNVMRADIVTPSLPRAQVLQNAPDTDANREFLRVRAILEE